MNLNTLLRLYLVEDNTMMTIDGCHITIDRGDTGVVRFIFSHKKQKLEVGTRHFRLIIKKHKEDADSSSIFDVTKQGIYPTDSYIAFSIPADITNSQAGSYFYGLSVLSDGYVNTISEGVFTIKQGTYYGVNA